VSASNRRLPLDNYPDEQPTSSAELLIVLELVPVATIGEALRNLATAILNAVSGRTSAQRKDNRQTTSQDQLHPPGT
jgi:hypothetical protein